MREREREREMSQKGMRERERSLLGVRERERDLRKRVREVSIFSLRHCAIERETPLRRCGRERHLCAGVGHLCAGVGERVSLSLKEISLSSLFALSSSYSLNQSRDSLLSSNRSDDCVCMHTHKEKNRVGEKKRGR